MKNIVDWGSKTGSSKFTTMNEVIVGIGFGITPLIAGYIVEWDIYVNFIVLIIIGLCVLIGSIFLFKKMDPIE